MKQAAHGGQIACVAVLLCLATTASADSSANNNSTTNAGYLWYQYTAASNPNTPYAAPQNQDPYIMCCVPNSTTPLSVNYLQNYAPSAPPPNAPNIVGATSPSGGNPYAGCAPGQVVTGYESVNGVLNIVCSSLAAFPNGETCSWETLSNCQGVYNTFAQTTANTNQAIANSGGDIGGGFPPGYGTWGMYSGTPSGGSPPVR